MTYRIWHIPQVPGKAFFKEVESAIEGKRLLETLHAYDLFQVNNNIKPDNLSVSGIQAFRDGEWEEVELDSI